MDYVIVSLIVFIIQCTARARTTVSENPHIIFPGLPSSKEDAVYYTVVKNKPLVLQFQNMTRGWCYNYYKHAKYLDFGTPGIINESRITLKKVEYYMSYLWKCNLTDTKDNDSLNSERKYYVFYLNLHVKGAKTVDLTVNGRGFTFSEADLSDPYDGATMLYYENKDQVDIRCRNRYNTGTVHLEYRGSVYGATNVSNFAKFSIQPHSTSNNSYIDCVYNTVKPVDKFVYRVTFTKKHLKYFNENFVPSLHQPCNTVLI